MKIPKIIKDLFTKKKTSEFSHELKHGDKIQLTTDQSANRDTPSQSYKAIGEPVSVSKNSLLVFLEQKNGRMFFLVTKNFSFAPEGWAEDNAVIYFSTYRFCKSKVIKYKSL